MSEQDPRFHEVPKYYSNVLRIMSNISGVSILFARNVPLGVEGDDTDLLPSCVVDLSPSQAKSLFLLLRHQLRNYEDQWGEIPVHPGLAEKYGEGL
mgnify:CR=1 FL=1